MNRILISLALVLYATKGFAQSPPTDAGAREAAALQRLSQAHAVADKPQAALEAIERALVLEPDNIEFLRARATLATWVGDYPRALDTYRRLRKAAPTDLELLLNTARVSAWTGRGDDAVEAYRQYLQAKPAAAGIWLELARTESWRGNYAAGLEALRSYRSRFGESTEYSRELAAMLARAGRPAKAEEVLNPLLRQDPANPELNLTRTIALAMQQRPREAFDALETVRQLQPASHDTESVERLLRKLLGSLVEPGVGFYSDSDSLEMQRLAPSATVSLRSGTVLTGGYERERFSARAGSGLEQVNGALEARHTHGWFGVAQRAGVMTFQGRVGRATAAEEPLTTYMAGATVTVDALKVALERSSAFLVVSPRTIGMGLRRVDHRAQVDWIPNLRNQIAFNASFQELSDGNRRWELGISPRRSILRTDRLNLDLGLAAYHFGTRQDLDHGYYDPRHYQRYSLVAYPYLKISENVGVSFSGSIGIQRDDRSRAFRFGGAFGTDVTFGIYEPWVLKVSGSAAFNQRLDSGAFQGSGGSIALGRRF